jgi:hypothetical protein
MSIQKVKFLTTALFALFFFLNSYTQQTEEKVNLQKQEKTLQTLYDSIANSNDDQLKTKLNKQIVDIWQNLLNHPETFDYPFDSLDKAGILKSPDNRIKLYNWNLPYESGEHDYFCFIQYKSEKKSEQPRIFELKDKSSSIENPEQQILNNNEWYGALYYKIIPIETRFDETYYTLLAYDPNDFMTNKKIVDVLHFNKNKPVFGASIFKNQRKISNRLIFEYGEFASMMLKYDEDKEMIVYDHLSPSKPKYKGDHAFYGPDFSYDGLKYENGVWNTYFDLDLRLNEIDFDD